MGTKGYHSFRPQQGLTIMNYLDSLNEFDLLVSFRPQQGLTIMNFNRKILCIHFIVFWFPSPTGVNYYELEKIDEISDGYILTVSVPNRG